MGNWDVPPLGIQLGTWRGTLEGFTLSWLRFYDREGRLLPSADERTEEQRKRAEKERERAEKLAQKLREMGVDPDTL